MKDCLFCKIIDGEIPSHKVYEDDNTLAFLDINPESLGHTLIIPKKHFNNYEDIDLETIRDVNETAKKVYTLIKDKLNPDGIRLVQNNGIIQDVLHYHLHIVPIYKGDKENIKDFEKVLELLK
ncbi:MAG: HIT family protein [bacterium]|nr:HIT family protein [bacterium]